MDLWDFLFLNLIKFTMKLFVTNQKEFIENFNQNFDENYKSKRNPLTSHQIHKIAFSILKKSVDIDGNIPIAITPHYDDGEGVAIFIFKNKKDDVFYYEYTGTAS